MSMFIDSQWVEEYLKRLPKNTTSEKGEKRRTVKRLMDIYDVKRKTRNEDRSLKHLLRLDKGDDLN